MLTKMVTIQKGLKGGENRMTQKGVIECREQFDLLLAKSRKVATNTTKHRYPLFGAEAA